MYRSVAITPEGFIQQLAVCYVGRGYWFYVTGTIPEHKDPAVIDRKLMERYRVNISKWARARRKRAGLSNVHYLRHGRFFVLLASHGQHELFSSEASVLRDARRTPIRFAGYAVSFRGGHPHVRIDRDEYLTLKAWLLERATRAAMPELCRAFRGAPFEPYAPVRRQLLCLWRAVNVKRKAAGQERVPVECIRLRRRIVRPFGEECVSSVLLPAHDELSGTSIPTEPENFEADPECADCRVERVEVRGAGRETDERIEVYAPHQQRQNAEVDEHQELAPAPTSDHAAAAGVMGLEGEELGTHEPVDLLLDLIDP